MTYVPHIRMVVRGIFNGTPEAWTYSLKWRKINSLNEDTETGDFNEAAVNAALTTFHANARFGVHTWVTGWRLYDIGADGLTQGNPRIVEYAAGSEIKGTGATTLYPLQTSVCVTTVGNNRGLARFGRFYLPGPSLAMDNTFRFSQTTAQNYLDAAVVMVKAVSNAIDIPQTTTSVPLVNESKVGTGTEQQVDFLKVGRVMDTISRRRTSLVEEYVTSGDIDW